MKIELAIICALASFKLEAASIGDSSLETSPFLHGGIKAEPGQFPYLAFISSIDRISGIRYVDSATLVSDRHLLAKADYLRGWMDVWMWFSALSGLKHKKKINSTM